MKSRGMAVVGAFLLIVLAMFVRSKLADDDSSSNGSKGNGGGRPVVACTPELQEVCDALATDGQIASDPPTLDLGGASKPDSEIDGWITWDPAPEIADFDAGQNEVWGPSDALGSARLAAMLDPNTTTTLVDHCTETTVWACVAGAPAAGLSVGVGDPNTSEGLSRLFPLAEALQSDQVTDGDLVGEEVSASDLRDIVTSADGQDAAPAMSQSAMQPGRVAIVVGAESLLGDYAGSAQGKNRKLSVSVATPPRTATIVIAPRVGRAVGDLADACEDEAVAEALRSAGVKPCTDDRDDRDVRDRAGFLYLVREKAS